MAESWLRRTDIDILGKELIFVPITKGMIGPGGGGMHWILVVINILKKKVQIHDSMRSHHFKEGKLLIEYMIEKGKMKPNSDADGEWNIEHSLDSPTQINGYDCGVYVCTTAAFLAERKILNYTPEYATEQRDFILASFFANRVLLPGLPVLRR